MATQRFYDLIDHMDLEEERRVIQALPEEERGAARLALVHKHRIPFEVWGGQFSEIAAEDLLLDHSSEGVTLDFCRVQDDLEILVERARRTPREYVDLKSDYHCYPISVGISPFASQRDIIGFIKENWDEILRLQRGYEPTRYVGRTRPQAKRDKYIYEHQDDDPRLLADEVNALFPSEDRYLGVGDILLIIKEQKERKGEE